jgi:hypothetical protein
MRSLADMPSPIRAFSAEDINKSRIVRAILVAQEPATSRSDTNPFVTADRAVEARCVISRFFVG